MAARILAKQAQQVWESSEMTVQQLADRLGISKRRASRLLQWARDVEAEQSTTSYPRPVVAIVTSRRGNLVTERKPS
jgi:CTP-dependent riboflavin kinase